MYTHAIVLHTVNPFSSYNSIFVPLFPYTIQLYNIPFDELNMTYDDVYNNITMCPSIPCLIISTVDNIRIVKPRVFFSMCIIRHSPYYSIAKPACATTVSDYCNNNMTDHVYNDQLLIAPVEHRV